MKNPWLRPAPENYPEKEIQSVSVEDRLMEIAKFDLQKLRAIILWTGTQKTVRIAAERKLKKLAKADGRDARKLNRKKW